MRGMAICTDTGIWEHHAILDCDDRRQCLQVDLVHDAVPRRNHRDIFESVSGPLDKMKSIRVAACFNRTVFGNRLRIAAAVFHRQ